MFSYRKLACVLILLLGLLLCACRKDDPTTTASDLPGPSFATAASTEKTTQATPGKTQPGTTSKTPASTTSPIPLTTEAPPPDYPFEPTVSGIYVTRDGEIRSAEVTPFDNSAFQDNRDDLDELKAFIESNVSTYNEAKGTEAVTIDSLTVEDGIATLMLTYASFNYFLDFQGDDFGIRYLTLLTKENAVRNYDIVNLTDPAGNPADLLVALERDDIKVLVVAGNGVVTVNGDILFLSDSLILNEVNTVRCTDVVSYAFIIFR